MSLLRKIKSFIVKRKNHVIFRGLIKGYQILKNHKSERAFRKMIKRITQQSDGTKPIHIVFIVQLMSLWGKMEKVFLEALNHEEVKVTLIAFPDMGLETVQVLKTPNETYDAVKKYGDMVVNAVTEDGKWFDLEKIKPDYVFYPRPYDHYLPQQYQSHIVTKYAKVCYIPYGFLLTETCVPICLNKEFFKNCYYYFAENTFYAEYNRKRFFKSHKKGFRKSEALGYPVFEEVLLSKGKISDSWNSIDSDGKFKMIWTPRWTTDKHAGGSNFFLYKDLLIDFVKGHEEMALVYRPHPLTFSNFIKTGELTEEQLAVLRKSYEECNRMYIEETAEYHSTFWGSDVLVTDVSSVDIEYFITGKPVIYCYRESVEFSGFAEKLYSVAYWAKDWKEVEGYLLKLQQGEDPLKEKRIKMVEDLLGTDFSSSANKIVEEIVKDYKGIKE